MVLDLLADNWRFYPGQLVRKKRGSEWHGRVVGFYSTDLTARGYAVESATEHGSVQIYPEAALEEWDAPLQSRQFSLPMEL